MNSSRDTVHPAEIVAYLRDHGWTVADDGYEGGVLWERRTDEGDQEVFAPMAQGAPDYRMLVHRLIETLARLEDRESSFILRDMKEAAGDVIRFRFALEGGDSSRLPLSFAPRVFKTAHDVTISAANAVTRRRSHYRKWTREVHEFAQRAEVGQTEPGSYVVRVLCPLTGLPQAPLPPGKDVPFGRRVTSTLDVALAASGRAAQAAITNGDIAAFDEAVESGVSSNLCSALASVREGPVRTTLEVKLRWAPLRDQPPRPSGAYFFGPDTLEVLHSAAKHLRDQEEEVLEDQTLFGYVTRCDRGANEDSGIIVVEGLIASSELREKVVCRIELQGDDYVVAARAHGDQQMITVMGTILRVGSRWSMSEVDALVIAS